MISADMRAILLLFMSLSLITDANAQETFNSKLKQELDSIFELDQKYRMLLSFTGNKSKADSISSVLGISNQNLWEMQAKIDSSNLARVERIFLDHGYPGKSLVGIPTNEAAYYVLQHSSKIKQYIKLIEEAANNGELPFNLYAKMLDRLLMQDNQEQIYGTQIYGFKIHNSESGIEEWIKFVWPIKDSENVNKRRIEAGIDGTVEELARRFGIEYKVLTLEDVEELRNK